MVDQFKVNIDNLESVYTTATKSAKYVLISLVLVSLPVRSSSLSLDHRFSCFFSRLVSLQNQLQNMQIKFMNQIRTSLRDYRKKLDETLQVSVLVL